jgi:hypothetical protein
MRGLSFLVASATVRVGVSSLFHHLSLPVCLFKRSEKSANGQQEEDSAIREGSKEAASGKHQEQLSGW